MFKNNKLYEIVAKKVGSSPRFVRIVDKGYRSSGSKCAAIVAALEAARRMEKRVERELAGA